MSSFNVIKVNLCFPNFHKFISSVRCVKLYDKIYSILKNKRNWDTPCDLVLLHNVDENFYTIVRSDKCAATTKAGINTISIEKVLKYRQFSNHWTDFDTTKCVRNITTDMLKTLYPWLFCVEDHSKADIYTQQLSLQSDFLMAASKTAKNVFSWYYPYPNIQNHNTLKMLNFGRNNRFYGTMINKSIGVNSNLSRTNSKKDCNSMKNTRESRESVLDNDNSGEIDNDIFLNLVINTKDMTNRNVNILKIADEDNVQDVSLLLLKLVINARQILNELRELPTLGRNMRESPSATPRQLVNTLASVKSQSSTSVVVNSVSNMKQVSSMKSREQNKQVPPTFQSNSEFDNSRSNLNSGNSCVTSKLSRLNLSDPLNNSNRTRHLGTDNTILNMKETSKHYFLQTSNSNYNKSNKSLSTTNVDQVTKDSVKSLPERSDKNSNSLNLVDRVNILNKEEQTKESFKCQSPVNKTCDESNTFPSTSRGVDNKVAESKVTSQPKKSDKKEIIHSSINILEKENLSKDNPVINVRENFQQSLNKNHNESSKSPLQINKNDKNKVTKTVKKSQQDESDKKKANNPSDKTPKSSLYAQFKKSITESNQSDSNLTIDYTLALKQKDQSKFKNAKQRKKETNNWQSSQLISSEAHSQFEPHDQSSHFKNENVQFYKVDQKQSKSNPKIVNYFKDRFGKKTS